MQLPCGPKDEQFTQAARCLLLPTGWYRQKLLLAVCDQQLTPHPVTAPTGLHDREKQNEQAGDGGLNPSLWGEWKKGKHRFVTLL